MTTPRQMIVVALAMVALDGCGFDVIPSAAATDRKVLPEPRRDGGPALASMLATRRSVRVFGQRELAEAELAQLLWAGQGVNDGHRTAPSAGALYPITLRVADVNGIWRYVPSDHALVRESASDRRPALARSSSSAETVRAAPAIIVVTAEFGVTARRYGERAERYATLEAGHVAQNILLEATALGLGAVPIGAFDDDAVRRSMDLLAAETPLYMIPVGAPP